MHVRRVEVPNDDALQDVARIRNAGRNWFTRNTDWIDPDEQASWFMGAPRTLWVWEEQGQVLGYALLTDRDGKTWIGLGVHPDWQGNGIGTQIYKRFHDVWAEIRSDNTASLLAALKAGYRVVYADDQKVVMKG